LTQDKETRSGHTVGNVIAALRLLREQSGQQKKVNSDTEKQLPEPNSSKETLRDAREKAGRDSEALKI